MPSSRASGSPGTHRARNHNLGLLSSTGSLVAGSLSGKSASRVWQPDANLNRSTGRPVAAEKTQEDMGQRLHTFWVCDVKYFEKVHFNLRQKVGRKPGDEIQTMRQQRVKQLFEISHLLIEEQQEEVSGTSTIEWSLTPCERATLLADRPVQLSTPKFYVFSDSVLC